VVLSPCRFPLLPSAKASWHPPREGPLTESWSCQQASEDSASYLDRLERPYRPKSAEGALLELLDDEVANGARVSV
jgi:hypothetical protein